jgi:DNA gyrase subunit A
LIQLDPGEVVNHQLCVRNFEGERYIFMATRLGRVKKTELLAFSRPKRAGIIALGLRDDDSLIGAAVSRPGDEIILGTRLGTAIRFPESDVRAMGRTAGGVGGITLKSGDEVVDMVVVDTKRENLTLLTVCENGYGKRTPVGEYRLQGRNGGGTINIRATERNGNVVGMKAVTDDDDIVLMSQGGILMRMSAADLRSIGRATQGVRLMSLKDGDKLTSIERAVREDVEAQSLEALRAESPGVGAEAAPVPAEDDAPNPGGVIDESEPALDEGEAEGAAEDDSDEAPREGEERD